MEHEGRSALIELYLERRADLIRFFTLRLRSAAAAEDLVQDIYIRLTTVSEVADVHNYVGYLYRLGSNLMLDRLRGERRGAYRDGAWVDTQRTVLGDQEVADEPSAETVVAHRQRLAALVQAVGELSPQTQRVFRMHKFDGLTHPQVAKSLGISRSAVEKHIMTALRHLSARMS